MKIYVPTRKTVAPTPLSIVQLDQLCNALDSVLAKTPCDNTLLFTETWLSDHGYETASAIEWLRRHGGFCDCEVLLNVEPKVKGG